MREEGRMRMSRKGESDDPCGNSRRFGLGSSFLLLTFTIFLGEIGPAFTSPSTSTSQNSTSSTTDLPSILERVRTHREEPGQGQSQNHGHGHKCYVCLPPSKESPEAMEILSLFQDKKDEIPNCDGFSEGNKAFEFRCPSGYRGCQLKTQGTNASRSCSRLQIDDCKTANSKEICFCKGTLCNGLRSSLPFPLAQETPPKGPGSSESGEDDQEALRDEVEEQEGKKFWAKGETDDEDLLGMVGDDGSSGDGPYPPGVIDVYTTTAKPTLVPNLRGEGSRVKTTPAPASGEDQRRVFCSLVITMTFLSLVRGRGW